MRRSIYIGLLFALCACLALDGVGPAGATRSSDDDPETTEVVIKLNAGSTIDAINSSYGTTTIRVLINSAAVYLLRVPTNSEADDLAKVIEDDSRVLYAEPNYSSEAPEGNPRHISTFGGPENSIPAMVGVVERLGLRDAHTLRRGSGVTVAVLDTGVQLDHPDLADRWTATRYDFIDDDEDPTDVLDGTDSDGDGFVDEAHGHGTHVAGIVHMVAPDARIMPLRVLDADGRGNIFVIAEAVRFAASHGADIINLSLGSAAESDLMEDILDDITEKYDIIVVAAAGNLSTTNKQFPAAEDGVLAVAALTQQDKIAAFSNFGDWIDIAAPGEGIESTFPVNTYAVWSGTSMAVPFVAGQAALLRSALPALPARTLVTYILDSARPIDDQNPDFHGQIGSGRINIGDSLRTICNDDGSCHIPSSSGNIILTSRSIVRERPSNGLIGTWVIGLATFVVDEKTEFHQQLGLLTVGSCADITYHNVAPFPAIAIRSQKHALCSQVTGHSHFLPLVRR